MVQVEATEADPATQTAATQTLDKEVKGAAQEANREKTTGLAVQVTGVAPGRRAKTAHRQNLEARSSRSIGAETTAALVHSAGQVMAAAAVVAAAVVAVACLVIVTPGAAAAAAAAVAAAVVPVATAAQPVVAPLASFS